MTVKELIEQLRAIDDQALPVVVLAGKGMGAPAAMLCRVCVDNEMYSDDKLNVWLEGDEVL